VDDVVNIMYLVNVRPHPSVVEDNFQVLLVPALGLDAHAPREHGVVRERRREAGPGGYCSPRYGMPFNLRDGSKCVTMT
jgi:hypothetical protein